MKSKFCIIGTDTNIGKTYVSCRILNFLAANNCKVLGVKPVASGLSDTGLGYINEDVYNLAMASNVKLSIQQINPFALEQPIAPHIAAGLEYIELSTQRIANVMTNIFTTANYDHLLIEGVGGLMVPLNLTETYLDLLIYWDFPVILVVGMKLGCLNHALLTYQQLISSGLNVAGWVANCLDDNMLALEDNLEYLKHKLGSPLLATVPYAEDIQPTTSFAEVFKCI